MKKALMILGVVFLMQNVSAQDVYNIADGDGEPIPFSCASGFAILTDSNSDNGNYGPDELDQITFCNGGTEGGIEVVVSPALYGHTWDVDSESSVLVYEGIGTGGTPIGVFNSIDDPDGFIATSGTGCITIVFATGSSSSGAGFEMNVQCEAAFQPFFVNAESTPPFEQTSASENSITLCFTDSFTVNAITDYPLSSATNGYEQSDETSFFTWQMGDGTTYSGFGETEVTHAYSNEPGHQVLLSVLDAAGTIEFFTFFVLQSPKPDFGNVPDLDTLCIGGVTEIPGGINTTTGDTLGFNEGTGSIVGGGTVGGQDEIFDADLNDCDAAVTIPLIIDEFEEGQVLEDVNDILNICVNVYHTFVGDLELGIACPNSNDTIILFDMMDDQGQCGGMFDGGFNGNGTDLGDTGNNIGFDYCFNSEPEFGIFPDEQGNGGNTMLAGAYTPEEPLEGLLGCPLNGEWRLIFKDSYQFDVGVINSWSLFFNPEINPSTESYSPEVEIATWEPNPDLVINDDSTSVTVSPSQPGDNSYTFYTIDEFGCRFDTIIKVYVRPELVMESDTACNLTSFIEVENAVSGGTFETLTDPFENENDIEYNFLGSNSGVDGGSFYEVIAPEEEYGVYSFLYTDANCGYTAEAFIDFRPDPSINLDTYPLAPILCEGATIPFDAGPQAANSDQFSITWIQNNDTINTETYAQAINEPGIVALIVGGFCRDSVAISEVNTLNYNINGDSLLCDNEASVLSAAIFPSPVDENGVSWDVGDLTILPADGIGFGVTVVNNELYGSFPITIVDQRCPNDSHTENHRWVEQPELNILPKNPEFCYEFDTLNLRAVLNGNSGGT
ncbi:MAG: hypothetical protein MK081_16220, partial [Flavobacteriales bacterium]|nr:hypothetical protein [Flavobacteriales bacterium]